MIIDLGQLVRSVTSSGGGSSGGQLNYTPPSYTEGGYTYNPESLVFPQYTLQPAQWTPPSITFDPGSVAYTDPEIVFPTLQLTKQQITYKDSQDQVQTIEVITNVELVGGNIVAGSVAYTPPSVTFNTGSYLDNTLQVISGSYNQSSFSKTPDTWNPGSASFIPGTGSALSLNVVTDNISIDIPDSLIDLNKIKNPVIL